MIDDLRHHQDDSFQLFDPEEAIAGIAFCIAVGAFIEWLAR